MFRVRRSAVRSARKLVPLRVTVRVQTVPAEGRRLLRWALPGWMLSLLIHASILAVLSLYLADWRAGAGGLGEGLNSDFSLLSGDGSATMFSVQMAAERDGAALEQTPSPAADAIDSQLEQPPPEVQTTAVMPLTAELSLPTTPVGPFEGAIAPLVTSHAGNAGGEGSVREFIRGTSGSSGGPPGGGGIGGTAFMGITDRATRVVYVIDSSASMFNNHAMQAAKAALLSSLQALDDSQQFQVIFYNERPMLLRFRGGRDPALAFATEINKSLARQEIAAVIPDLGTNHIDALKLAMRLSPDVIYLLTDADEPQLSAGELDQLRKSNQGRSRLHCIEFGKGPPLSSGTLNFLQKLAAQNGGQYRYEDVKRFGT